MERFSQYISRRLSTGCNLTDYKKLQLQLGIEVILHNILMIGNILVVSSFFGLLFETIIFFWYLVVYACLLEDFILKAVWRVY